MVSIFYKNRFERRFNITLLLLERIAHVFGDNEGADTLTQEATEAALSQCLVECNLVAKVSDDDLTYALTRLQAMVEEDAKAETPPTPSTKKTFASSYSAWAGKLQTDQICLVAAGFDYFLAQRMYLELDKEDVVELAKRFLEREWEKIKIGYESVVYGFGGSYDGDSNKSDSSTVDLSKGAPDKKALAQLKNMGF